MKTFLIIAALLFSAPAYASVTVNDLTNTLTPTAKADLEATPTQHRVKANFLNTSSQQDMDRLMGDCVDTPNTVCIGVDPVHHWTFSHFGVDTGVRSSDFTQVAKAGDLDFKQAQWTDGIKSIISRANAVSIKSNAPAAVVINQPVVEKDFPLWPFFLGGVIMIIGIIAFVEWARKKNQQAQDTLNDARSEVFEMASRNINQGELSSFDKKLSPECTEWLDKNKENVFNVTSNRQKGGITAAKVTTHKAVKPVHHYNPATGERHRTPAPVVVNNSSNDLLTGVLVGQAISNNHCHHSEPAHHHSSYDSGSSGSSYDSSSSYDSGSSGSSFDSSSSFDCGGGGGGF
jgi:uncharacterized membrane protein YgcG